MKDIDRMSYSLDIGCGFLSGHKKRGFIGIDLRPGLCNVVADAEHLPFRQAVFNDVYLVSILEHLDHPIKCLKEALRVARNGAHFQIVVPVEARYLPLFFRMMILGFPFGIFPAISLCQDIRRHKKLKGYLHANRIQPRHILFLFRETTLTKVRRISHPWFSGHKGKILSKIFGSCKITLAKGNWVIKAKK